MLGLLPCSTSCWNIDKFQAISKTTLQGTQRDSLLSSCIKIHVFYMTLISGVHLLLYRTQFYYALVGSCCFQEKEQILRMACKTSCVLSYPYL